MKKPNSLRHLDDAIRRTGDGTMESYVRSRTLIANAIVAQMLPDGVVKGGSALKMRYGRAATRFTTDLDTATSTDPDLYAARLDSSLAVGWDELYAIQAADLDVLPDVESAVEWANRLIERIAAA